MPVTIHEAGETVSASAPAPAPAPTPTPAAVAQPVAARPAAPNKMGTIAMLTDASGRRIGVRTLSLVDELRMTRLLGGTNPAFMWFCMKLAHVTEINGEAVSMPSSEGQFDVLAQRVGYEGMRAINAHLEAEAKLEELRLEEHRAAVGNS